MLFPEQVALLELSRALTLSKPGARWEQTQPLSRRTVGWLGKVLGLG